MSKIASFIKRHPLIAFYAVIGLLEWALVAPLGALSPMAVGLIAFTPAAAAFITVAVMDGKQGVKSLWRRALAWRMGRRWYLIALSVPLLVNLAAAIVSLSIGSQLAIPLARLPSLIIFTFILAAGEEIGWRGFAFPRLLDRYSLLTASIIFGLLHAAFHLPMYLLSLPDELRQASPFWLFTILVVSFAVPAFWMHVRTRGNVAIGIVYHTAINVFTLLISGTPREVIAWLLPVGWAVMALVFVVIILPVSRSKTQSLHTQRTTTF